jgi:hypothetical protein
LSPPAPSRAASIPSGTPSVSVVVPIRLGWPAARFVLDPLRDQAAALAAEVIAVDGSGRPRPPSDAIGPAVRWVERPGATVFQLMEEGIALARGAIVAMTEDHCRVSPDWLESILRAFAEHPEATAIGGSVANGTDRTVLDRASFYSTKGGVMAPVAPRPRRITSESNVAYRRSVLEGASDGVGVQMVFHNEDLRKKGAVLLVDDRIVVDHHQSLPLLKTSSIHFHDGRAFAGVSRERMGWRDVLRLVGLPALPLFRSARTAWIVLGKGGHAGPVLQSLPYIIWLNYCHAMGTAIGYLTGVGRSAEKLH